jgi:GAF domain-containing protein
MLHRPFLCHAVPLNRNSGKIDEESFQRLLCAAFTIQEYRDQRLSHMSMMRTFGPPEPFNSVEYDPDLKLDDVCASEDEGVDTGVLLERVQQQFDLPALPTDVGTIGISKASLIANNDGVSPPLIIGFDIPHEQVAPIAENQLLPSDDLMGLHAPAVGGGTGLRNPVIGVAPDAAKELLAAQNDLAREVVQQVLQATHATSAAFGLCLKGRLIWEATAGDSASEIRAMLNTGSGFAGLSASSGTMQSCGNTVFDSRPDAEACRRLGLRAVVVVPLSNRDRLLGVVAVFSRKPYAFGMRDLQALQDLTEEFTAKLQVRVEAADASTGRESPIPCNLWPSEEQSGC